MRALESALVGLALLIAIVGGALAILMMPWFTRALVTWLDVPGTASLSTAQTIELAEEVRAFVAHRGARPLPETVDGREAFDATAVAHLVDVREVILRILMLAIVSAAGLLVWLVVCVTRKRRRPLVVGLRAGALVCVALPFLVGVAGAMDFDRFFTAFHGVFFEPGTWTFPFGSLLITLFPERFWASAGTALGIAIAVGGLLLWAASVGVDRRFARSGGHSGTIGT